jgi:hypothetical protein
VSQTSFRTIGVTGGDAVQVDQAVTATTRATTTTLGTSLNHELSNTAADITAFHGVAGVTNHCRATGAGKIVNSAGLIVTQGLADITTAAGDTFDVEMLTATTSRVKNYVSSARGTIIQIVNASYSTETLSSSSTLADTGLTATITPKYATSKILVCVHQAGCAKTTSDTYMKLALLRGATILIYPESIGGYTNSTARNYFGTISASYEDSPATTSATIYKTQFASGANAASVAVQVNDGVLTTTSTITLMEIRQ